LPGAGGEREVAVRADTERDMVKTNLPKRSMKLGNDIELIPERAVAQIKDGNVPTLDERIIHDSRTQINGVRD
jgi:hypothetical protein